MRLASLGLVLLCLPAAAQPVASLGQETRLIPFDLDSGDELGTSVAVSGDRAVVGAPEADVVGTASGAAYVFVRQNGEWTEEAKLLPDDGAFNDRFGSSVAISGDLILVGAEDPGPSGPQTGSVYAFSRSGGTWTQEARMRPDQTKSRSFGRALDLEGNRALIGASADRTAAFVGGAGYIFEREAGGWVQKAQLLANDAAQGQQLGQSVSLSGDRALLGAPLGFRPQDDAGAAYVFIRQGGTWVQEARLVPDEMDTTEWFGDAVSLSGSVALIGADRSNPQGTVSGAAFVFTRSGGTWSQTTRLLPSDGSENDTFGTSVALSGNGAIISAPSRDSGGLFRGAVYVYGRSGSSWNELDVLTASDGQDRDGFGKAVALDGNTAIIGVPDADVVGPASGAAYAFSEVGPVSAEGTAPEAVVLSAPAPNPASGGTVLTLSVDRPQRVRVAVVDALGREVGVPFEAAVSGPRQIHVPTRLLPSGVYTVQASGDSFQATQRLTVVR